MIFGGGSSGTAGVVTLGSAITVGTLTFNPAFAGNYTIAPTAAEVLTINGGINANDSVTITADILLGGAQSWTVAATKLLTVGNVNNGGNLLTITGAGNTTIGGILSGVGGLTKTLGGTLNLTGANTYTGVSTINAGAVILGSAETAGVSGPLGNSAAANPGSIVLGGGTLQYSAANQNDYSGRFSTAASQAYKVDTNGQTVTWATALTSSGGALTKSGAGTLILSGANTYSGGTTLSAGTLQLSGSGVLPTGGNVTVQSGTLDLNGLNASIGTLTLGGVASGTPLVQTGAGVLTLGGNVTYDPTGDPNAASITGNLAMGAVTRTFDIGDVVANAVDTSIGAIISGSAGFTKAGAGTLALTGANTFTGNIAISGGALQVTGTGAAEAGLALGAAGARTITLTNNAAFQLITANFNPTATTKQFVVGSGGGTFDVASALTLQFDDANQLSGSGDLTKTNTGTLFVTNQGGFTGKMIVSGGVLSAIDTTAFGSEVQFANATTLTLRGNINSSTPTKFTGDTTIGGAFAANFSNVELGAATTRQLTVTATAVNFSNPISVGVGLTKAGAGLLALGGANTYTGPTSVTGGVLVLNNATALPGGIGATGGTSALSVAGGQVALAVGDFARTLGTGVTQVVVGTGTGGFFAQAGNRTVNFGGTATWGSADFNPTILTLSNTFNASGTLDFQSPLDLNLATRTVQVDDSIAAIDARLSGGFTGGAASIFTKTGAGTLLIPGASAAGSATFVMNGANGTVLIGDAGALGANALTLTAGTLASSSSTAYALSNSTVTLGGNITLGQAVGGTGALTFAAASATAVRTITVNNAGPNIITGAFSGTAGGIIKTGPGTLTLKGTNSATGATTVNQGMLELDYGTNDTTKLANAAILTLGGGTLKLSGGTHPEAITTGVTIAGTGHSSIVRGNAGSSLLTMLAISRTAAGGTIDIGEAGLATTTNANISGILGGYATFGGNTWAVGGGAITGLAVFATNDFTLPANNTDVTSAQSPAAFTINSLRFNTAAPANVTLTGVNVISSGGILVTSAVGANNLTISGGTSLAGSSTDLIVLQNNTQGTLNISSLIAASGTSGLTKSGAGTLILSNAANTYTGKTSINAGTISIATDGAASTNNPLGFVPAAATAGQLTFSGGTLATTATMTLAANRGIALNAAGGTIDVASGTTLTYGGIAAGAGSLTKTGTGGLTLSGLNTYTGVTTLNQGTMTLDGGASTGARTVLAGPVVLNNGSAVVFLGTGAANVAMTAGTSTLLNSGSSTITRTSGAYVLRVNQLTRNVGSALNIAAASIVDTDTPAVNGILGGWATLAGTDWATIGLGSLSSTAPSIGADNQQVIALPAASYTTSNDQTTWGAANNVNVTTNPLAALNDTTINSLKLANVTTTGTVTLNGGQTLTVASGGILNASGSVPMTITGGTLRGAAGLDLVIHQNSFAALTINSVIADNISATALTKSGFGSLVLGAANTFTGPVYLNQGTLSVASDGNLGAGTNVVFGGNPIASAILQTTGAVAFSSARTVTLNGDGTVNASSTAGTTLSGAFSGAGGFTKTGTQLLTLSGNNTNTGSTTVSAGILSLDGAAPNGSLGSTALTINNGGTLRLNNTSALNSGARLADTAAITMNGGTLNFANNAGAFNYSETTGVLTAGTGLSTVTTSQAATSQTSTLTLGSLSRNVGATLNFTGTGLGVGAGIVALRNRVVFTTAPSNFNGILGGWATVGNDFAKYSADVDTVTAGNQPSVTALIAADYLTTAETTWTAAPTAGTQNAKPTFAVNTTTTLTASRNLNSLNLVSTGTAGTDPILALAGNTLTLASGGLLLSGTDSAVISATAGGALTAGPNATSGYELITSPATGLALAINAPITNNGANALTFVKSGLGSVTMGGVNTYTGPTYINSGTLTISADTGLGAVPGAATPGSLVFNGGTLTISGANTINSNRGVLLNSGGGTISNAAAVTYSAIFAGTGNLTKAGAGTLTMAGTNTYTGSTTVSAGGLAIGNDNRLGTPPTVATPGHLTLGAVTLQITGATTLNSNRGVLLTGNLTILADSNLTYGGVIEGGFSINSSGSAGTLTLSGLNTYTGKTSVSGSASNAGGGLNFNSIRNVGAGNVSALGAPATVANGTIGAGSGGNRAVLVYSGTGDTTDRVVDLASTTGTVFLDQSGTGLLKFTSAFTATGAGAKTLTIQGSTAGTGELAGAIVDNGGANTTSLSKAGTGIWTLTGDNTFTGNTDVSAGTLILSGTGDIAQSTNITVRAGGTLQINNAATDTSVVDRLGNSSLIFINDGGFLNLHGTTAVGTTTEDVGALFSGNSGLVVNPNNTVTMTPGSGRDVQFQADSFARSAGTSILFRGTGLGSAAGSDTSRIKFDVTPTLLGGGGAAGTTTISILPSALADTSTTGLGGSGFVTYDSTLGVRLLNLATEYDTTLVGTANRNINLTGNTVLAADQTIGSLRIAGADLTINASQTLADTSGSILFTTTNNINGPGTLALGTAEGFIFGLGGAAISPQLNASVSGSGGLTINMLTGNTLTLGGNNTFSGMVTVNSGTLKLGASNTLGQSTQSVLNPLRLNLGSLDLNGQNATIGALYGAASAGGINNTSATPVTLTIDTTNGLYTGPNSSYSGVISNSGGGAVSVVKAGSNTQTLAAASTFTGTVDVMGGTLNMTGTFLSLAAGGITIRNGATFAESIATNAAVSNRIIDTAAVTIEGGTFNFNLGGGAFNYSETVGGLTLNSGGSTVNANRGSSGQTSRLTFSSLTANAGATVNFTGANLGDLADVSRNQILFTSAPSLPNGIIGGYATLNGLEWATYVADADTTTAGAQPSVSPLAAYTSNPAESGFLTTLNVKQTTGTTTLAANRVINSLNLAQSAATILDIGAAQKLNVESGGILVSGAFNSTIQNGTLTAGTGTGGDLFFHTYSPAGSVLTVSSVIDDDGIGNVVNITKAGTGEMLLSGANTFTGSTTLNNGTLLLGSATALGNTTANVRLNSGTLASDGATTRTIANPVTIGGNITFGEAAGGTGALVLSGAVDMNGAVRTLTFNNPSANVNEISGLISGSGGFIKTGNGLLKLNGAVDNAYSGITVVNQGTLLIDNTTLTADRNPLGSGQLRLGGGTLTIMGGGAGGPYADAVTSANVNAGHSRITTSGSPTYVLRLNTLSAVTGGTLDFAADSIAQVDNVNVNGILGGYATVNGANWAMNSAGLDGAVTGLSSYTNGASTASSSWTVASNLTFASSPAAILDNANASTLKFTAGSGVNLAAGKTLTLASGGILNTGTGLSGVAGGVIRGGGAQQELVVHQYNTAQPLIIASVIADNGSPTALVKSGPGELILANEANTFTGVKYLNGGTLTINPTTIAEGSVLNSARSLGAITASSIDIIFNGGTLALGPLTGAGQATAGPLSGNRQIRLDANGGTLVSPSVSGVPRVFQVDPVISGVGSLTFSGNGAFLPNATTNLYTGGTILNANAIVMPNTAGSFGTGPITLNDKAILTAWAGTARTLANSVNILGDVTLGYTGVTGGTLSTGALTLTGAVDLGGATRMITVDTSRVTTLSGIVSNGVLTKTGAGTLTLSGANSFSGPLTVNNGILIADTATVATVLNSSIALTLGGATFRLSGLASTVRSQILNGLTINSGASVVDVNQLGTSTTLDLRGAGGVSVITRNSGAVVDFRASTGGPLNAATAVIKTAQANVNGILGGWATANSGADFAKNDGSGNIIAAVAADYTDITVLGPSVIPDDTTKNVRIVSGGTSGGITLAAATTNINTLTHNVATAATIPTAGSTLRLGTTGAILVTPTAAALSLTIGAAPGDGFLTAGGNAIDVAGELILNPNNSTATAGLIINAVIANNGTGAVSLTKAGSATVTINTAATYSGATVIGAGTLKLGAANVIPNGAANGDVTVNGTLDLNDFSETINGLNGYGTITNVAGTGTRTLTIGDNDASGTFSGIITAGTGTTGLTKIGTGTQTFAGQAAVSTYTGPTAIQDGALRLEGGFNRLPVATTLTLGNLTTSGKLIVARDQTVAGIVTSGSGTANAIVGGATDVATFTVNLAADATFGGKLGGAGANENNLAFTKSGIANLTLTAANTATGNATINAGTLTLGGGNGSLAASGITILTGGTLLLDNSTSNNLNRIADSSSVTLVGGVGSTTLRVQNDGVTTGTYSELFGPLIILGSSGTVTINNVQAETGSSTSTSTLTFASLIKSSGVTLDFMGEGLGDSDENRIFFTGLAAGPIPGATVTSVADGTDDAEYNLTLGVIRLLNYDTTYTINSHPAGGSLAGTPTGWTGSTIKANPAGGVRLTAAASVTINQLKLDNDGTANTPGYNAIDLNGGTLTLATGALRSNGVANQSVIDSAGGGKLTAGTGLAPGVLTVTAGVGNQLSIGAVIGNNGVQPVSLIKIGDGSLVLTGINTFTGKTAVNAGTLSIAADSGLGVAPGAPLADSLTLNGGTLLLGNGSSLAATRGITLGSSHGTVKVDGTDSATINGIIAGAARNLTKTGTGTLTLNRANTFSGIMTLNGGSIIATASTGALGAGTLTLTSGNLILKNDTALAFARNTTINGTTGITTDRLIAGAGVTHTLGTLSIGAQTLTVSAGANMTTGTAGFSFTGAVTATGAPIFTVNNNGTAAVTLLALGSTVASGANLLTFNGSGNSTVTGVITGSGGLTASGAGVVTLTANNGATLSGPITIGAGGGTVLIGSGGAFGSGATTINGGTLSASGSGALTVANNLTVGGNFILGQAAGGTGALTLSGTVDLGGATRTITVNNAGPDIISGVISNTAGGLTKAGTGTLTLTGANTFTGGLTVSRGTLIADTLTNATILDSSLSLSMGGATFRLSGLALTARSQILNGLTLTAGANVVDANNVATATSTLLDLTGTGGTAVITRSAGSSVDFKATTGGPLNATTAMIKSAQANDATGILGAWATVDSGANLAMNNGSNFILAYTGYTNIDARGPTSTIADATASNVRINTAGTAGAIALGAATTNINTLMQNTATAAIVDTAGKILRLGTTGSIMLTPTAAAAGTLTIGSAVNDGTLTAGGNADDVAGELIFNNNATTAALTVNAVVANNGAGVVSLTKSGVAPLILAGTNTYSGPTNINAGTLTVGGAGTLGSGSYAGALTIASGATFTYSSSAAQTLSGVISGDGVFSKAGTGVLTLSGANTFTSNLTVTGGALVADTATNATVLNSSSALVLGDATFQLKGLAATVRSQILNGLTLNANTTNVVDVNNLGTSTTLDLRGTSGLLGITRNTGSTVDFRATTGTLGTTAIVKTAQPNVNGILGVWATVNGGADLAANDGTGTIIAYTGYTDVTRLSSGSKTIVSATANNVRIIEGTGTAAEITPAASGTTDINTLIQSISGGTSAITFNPGTTDILRLGVAGGIMMVPNAGALTIGTIVADGFLTAGGAPATAGDIFLNNNSSAAMTINSVIANNGAGVITLTKGGTGSAVLTATNTYTGATTISDGSLQLGDGGTSGSLSISSALVNNGALIFNRSNAVNQGADFISVISGIGALTQKGAGTLTLSGTNTFMGDVTLSGGTLVVGMTTALTGNLGSVVNPLLTSKTIFITNNAIFRNTTTWNNDTGTAAKQQFVFNIGTGGGTIETAAGTTLTFDDGSIAGNAFNAAQLQGSGNLTKIGDGTLSLGNGSSNFGTFTGQIFVNNGTLTTGAVSSNPFGDTANGTTVASGAVLDVKGVSIGAEPLTISGTGISGGGVLISSAGTGGTATGPITLAADSSVGGATALTLSGNITGAFAITKVGAGNLTLSGTTNTFSGGVNLNVGTLTLGSTTALGATAGTFTIEGGTSLDSSVANLVNANANPVTMNGDFTFIGTQSLNLGLGAVSLGSTAGTRTVTTTANILTLGGVFSDGTATALTKAGAGTLALGGANAYTGLTTITGGMLLLNHVTALPGGIAVTGGTSGLTLNGGVVGLGNGDFNRALGTGVDQVQFTGSGGFAAVGADRIVNLGGANVALTWNTGSFVPTGSALILSHVSADKTVDFQHAIDLAGAVRTIQVDNGTAAIDAQIGTAITGAAGSGLTKSGAGTLVLSGLSGTSASNYEGTTTLNGGTLAITTGASFSGGLTFGTAGGTILSSLDLSAGSATFAGATIVQTNSVTANTISIGTTQTLLLNGAVTIGTTGSSTTKLNVTGLGTLSIGVAGTPTNANVQLGANVTTNVSNAATLDMSGLTTFYANLGTGTFRVGDATNSGGTATGGSTLILAANSTITAATLGADSQDSGVTQAIKLGSGANRFNVTTLNIGAQNGRSNGTLGYDVLNTTGTLTVRGLAGGDVVPDNTSRATLNVVNNIFGTGANPTGSFDTTGRTADLRFETMTIAGRSASTGTATGTFSFDTGTLDSNDLIAGSKAVGSTSTGNIMGTVNLGGGSSTFNSSTNALRLGVNATTNGTATGILNVSGGTVTVAANGGNAILLGQASLAGGTGAGQINITGSGSLTVAGDIVKGTATGTVTSTLTLNGSTAILDMSGNDITGLTSIIYTDGLLKNLGVVNTGMTMAGTGSRVFDQGALFLLGNIQGIITGTGVGLTKQGAGILQLSGANTYDGVTTVSGGVLGLNNVNALPGGIGASGGTSGLTLNGGVLGFGLSDFTRSLGTGVDQVQWTGSGGFAAFATDRNVNLGGSSAGVTWNSGSFVPTGSALIFGDANTDKTVTFQNPIDFNGADRTIQVNNGAAAADAVITGGLSGTAGSGLTKTGAGTLVLSGTNTYAGTTTVSTGTLQFANQVSLYNNTPVDWTATNLVVNGGATAAFNVGGSGQFTSANIDTLLALGTVSGGFKNGSIAGLDTSSGSFTYNSVIANPNSGANALGLTKLGSNTLTLTAASNYTGPTTIVSGVLQVGTAAITTASIGSGVTTVASTATLAGTGTIGGVTTVQSGGIIAPGDANGSTNNTLTLSAASATVLTISNGGQLQLSITNPTLISSSFEAYRAAGGGNAADYLLANPGEVSLWNVAPGTITDHDWLNLTGAGSNLSIGTRSSATYGFGSVLVSGTIASPSIGMVFNLMDWVQALNFGGTFTNGGGTGIVAGGLSAGDLDLPSLGGGNFAWDTSAFQSHGILVVVPEPGRALLLLFGLLGLLARRRRQVIG